VRLESLRPAVLAAMLITCPCAADEIAVLPVGDAARALELVTGSAGDVLDLAGAPDASGSRVRSLAQLAEALAASADVVVIGEHHGQGDVHRFQADLLRELGSRRPVALGMEFFESEDDAALADYGAGRTDAAGLLETAGWYASGGFPHGYYLPVVDAAKAAGAPVFGLNVPRSVVRTISREGLDALTPEQRALVGDLGDASPAHRFVVDLMMGGIGSSMGPAFEGMLRGQRAWDAAMASSILRARQGPARDRLVVAIAGVGHSAHGLGIPARLRAADPALRVAVLNPVVAEKPGEHAQSHPGMEATASAVVSRGYADWAYVLADAQGAEELPTFGMKLEAGEDGVVVASVEPGSVADRAGVRAKDVLVRIDEDALPRTLPAVRFRLAQERWGERVVLGVRRAGAEIALPALLVPAADGPGRWLSSRPASCLLDGFDPASSRPLRAEAGGDAVTARLVEHASRPVRLDVLGGTRLLQAWTLDAAGRVVSGLLAEPAADGAVRVEIERSATGETVAVRRLDAAGREVAAP
jgi:uncharacterized iron-regulated protein